MRVLKHTRWLWLAAIALLAVIVAMASTPAAGTQAPRGRLDSQLETLVETLDLEGEAAAFEDAETLGVDAGTGEVRVIIDSDSDVSEALVAAGATVEFTHDDLAQVRAPIASLETLAAVGGVEQVRVPLRAVPFVTGEGVALTNADDWQAAGVTGAGVKVAIVDLGFAGYTTKLGTELPASVTAMSFRGDGDITGAGQPHGTGVAEIVHEMAPGAQLYLVNFDSEVSLAAATAYLDAQDIDVVNASWGYFVSGPGDGTGIVNDIVSDSVDNGTFWSVSAGNHAAKHWSGQFRDTNSNGFHEFALSPTFDEGNEVSGSFPGFVLAGDDVAVELKWDDPFGASCRDYDLYLKRTDQNNQVVTVAFSENPQYDGGCVPGADPVEVLTFTATVSDTYHMVIQEFFSPSDANMDLYSAYGDIEYVVTANSLVQPADNPDVTTVAAVPFYSPTSIEPFSSRGPTKDGRTKPDISAPDGVSNSTFGNFFGTSAASPHMAGAAALLLDRLPCYAPAQVGATLEANVVDLGAAGKDNTFGAGRMSLGAAPADMIATVSPPAATTARQTQTPARRTSTAIRSATCATPMTTRTASPIPPRQVAGPTARTSRRHFRGPSGSMQSSRAPTTTVTRSSTRLYQAARNRSTATETASSGRPRPMYSRPRANETRTPAA